MRIQVVLAKRLNGLSIDELQILEQQLTGAGDTIDLLPAAEPDDISVPT